MSDNRFEEIVGLKELKVSDLRTHRFDKVLEYFNQYPIVELDDIDARELISLLNKKRFSFTNYHYSVEVARLINVLIKKRYDKDKL